MFAWEISFWESYWRYFFLSLFFVVFFFFPCSVIETSPEPLDCVALWETVGFSAESIEVSELTSRAAVSQVLPLIN